VRQASFLLPRPRGSLEDGGEVSVRVPPTLELLPLEGEGTEARPGWAAGLTLVRGSPHEQTWRWARRAPERIEVSWRPYQPEVQLRAVVDVALTGRTGRVRHELHFPGAGDKGTDRAAPPAPESLTLQVPPALGELRVLKGGRLAGPARAGERGPALQTVRLGAPAQGQPVVLTLEYTFAQPEPGRPGAGLLAVPLVVPVLPAGGHGETRVRVWGEPGSLPSLSGPAAWVERNLEAVSGHEELPALVVEAPRIDLPLWLRSTAVAGAGALIDRALVQVDVDGGMQSYRARYRLVRLTARRLEVELPVPVLTVELSVRLGGRPVPYEAVEETGRRSDGGRVARLRLPSTGDGPSVLEVSYRLAPGRLGGGPLATVLQPPIVRGVPEPVPTRWQVRVPAGWVVLGPEGGPGTPRTWGLRGWLLAPRLAVSPADLERWFAGPAASISETEPERPPDLVAWRDGPEALRLTHAPQQAWLLACSLALLLVGLALTRYAWSGSTWPWLLLGALVLAAVLVALRWPTAVGQVAYGCQPGAAVLLLVALAQWLWHERTRRQVIFLPSFTRGRPGSSVVRDARPLPGQPTAHHTPGPRTANGREPPRPGEPSTVDAPPRSRAPGSSSRGPRDDQ
jgi:hypothetical protein